MSWKSSMAVVFIVAGLVACRGGSRGSLTVSAKGAASAPADVGNPVTLDAGHGIQIKEIRLVVRKLEVEGPGATCTPITSPAAPAAAAGASSADGGASVDGSGSDDESCEIEQGPFLVELSGSDLRAGTHPMFDASVPAGTYEEIALRIGTLSAEQAAQAPVEAQRAALSELAGQHASVVVLGTMDGSDFTFAAPLDVRQEREGSITVDPRGGVDLTFTLSPSGWFTAADGLSKLDPTSTDPAVLDAILANVRASLRLVHDEDHDGSDDELDDHGAGPG